ncbi:hypothetical protein [Acinetobacter sp. LA-1]|uniref:hypothetical protein n=1 Tax=Acinetobacter sp. LA-1 TaxID=3438431 RepID=UPI003F32BB9B
MDVIEYLENLGEFALASVDFYQATVRFNQFHGAYWALTGCHVYDSNDQYNKATELYLQLVEYLNATYNMNIEYDATELFV